MLLLHLPHAEQTAEHVAIEVVSPEFQSADYAT